jgi:hypothetical protein
LNKPSEADRLVFEEAIREVAGVTERLVHGLTARAPTRTREGEREKARARWAARAPAGRRN